MADQFDTNPDEIKKAYLEKALNANKEAADGSKFSDLFNKDSSLYAKPAETEEEKLKREEEEKARMPKPKPTTDSEGFPIIDPVHTYREDLAGIINKDKVSLERIAMMQSTEARNMPEEPKLEVKRSRKFLIAGGALLLLGTILIFSVFIFRRNAAAPAEQAVKEKYIIVSESSQNMSIANSTKTEIKSYIKKLAENFKEQDNVMEIIPTLDGEAGIRRAALGELFGKTDANVPDDLARSLAPRFFLGLYSKVGNTNPFLILYTSSYDIAYPAMLRWEGILETDFNWLFEAPAKVGTTTPVLAFKDKVVANTDTRSYESASGKAVFFYIFLDQNTILLARTADTVRMVQSRLRQAKFQ